MDSQPFYSFDDYKLHTYELNEVKNPKAIIQIIHGLGEHGERYENIANFLVSQGFIVFISDQRAHGKTAESLNDIGVYPNDIFYDAVKDQIFISEYLLQKYKLPLIVIGHSFGSFIAERYHELYHKHSALILTGSNYYKNDFSIFFGNILATIVVALKGKNTPAKLINKYFTNCNKKFSDQNWLTSDKLEQQKVRVDRYCNRIFSYNFYKYFFRGISHIYQPKNLSKIKLETPILVLSGQKDMLNKNGDAIKKLPIFYKQIGVKTVKLRIYENMRHNILNEIGKEKVYADILKFIKESVIIDDKEDKKEKKTK